MKKHQDLIKKAEFYADIEGKSLDDKVTELLEGWINGWESFLEQFKSIEKTKSKVIPLDPKNRV